MAYFIDERTIEEIKDRADIVSEISKYVDLKKVGANYKGLCPFHSERTPSFTVSPHKGIFKCFGCGEGGNVINFLMKIEGLSFPEACKKLGDAYGVQIENKKKINDERSEQIKMMYQINRELAIYYMRNLADSKRARDYLARRGISLEIARKFGLGYSKDSWDHAVNYLKSLNYDLEAARVSGAIGKNQKGNYYDYYRDRIIFPIIDTRSRVLGFGARALGEDMPKYLNTSESPIFHKGRTLYGLNLLNRNKKLDKVILVEGYMDVIALESHGIRGSVASLGTALTVDQVNLMRRYTNNLYISYDGDQAGITATKRALEIIQSLDWNAEVIELPGGVDPDTFLHEQGKYKYESEMTRAVNGYNYLINAYKTNLDLTKIDDQAKLIRYIGNTIRKIKSPIQRELQMKELSNNYGVSLESIKNEIYAKDISKDVNADIKPQSERRLKSSLTSKDRTFLGIFRLILNNNDIYFLLAKELKKIRIRNNQLREVYYSIESLMLEEGKIDKGSLLRYLSTNNIIDDIIYNELYKETDEFDNVSREELADELISRLEITDKKLTGNQLINRIQELEEKANRTTEENRELRDLLSELMGMSNK